MSDYERSFSRNLGIVTPEEQQVLRTATVAIVGLGGIGGNVAVLLARMGVGRFRLADFDRFELANINRQYGANPETVGRPKCEVMAEELRRINPEAQVEVFDEGFTAGTADRLLAGAGLAVDAVDFYAIETHLALHEQTRRHGLPTLMGSPVGFSACLQVFEPDGMSLADYCGITPGMDPLEKQLRYACGLVPELAHIDYYDVSTARSNTDFSAGTGPSMAGACGLAASLVAIEAVLLLLRRRPSRAVPRTLQFDPYTFRCEWTHLPGGMRDYDPAPVIRRIPDRSSLVPQVLDHLYGKRAERRVRVNGADLFWRDEGSGEPVVLVSPLGADSSFWARQHGALAGRRVITYDARGSGGSSPCPQGCSVDQLAEDLVGLLDHLGVSGAHLVGLALGGLVAAEVAARRPDLAASLVLVSAYPVADERIRAVTASWRELSRGGDMEELFEQVLHWIFTPDHVLATRVEMDKLKTFFRLTVQDPESFRQQSLAGVRHDARPALARVRCPALVVHGGSDRLVGREHATELAGLLPEARLVVLEPAAHFLTWEHADDVNVELVAFLDSVAARGAGVSDRTPVRQPAGLDADPGVDRDDRHVQRVGAEPGDDEQRRADRDQGTAGEVGRRPGQLEPESSRGGHRAAAGGAGAVGGG